MTVPGVSTIITTYNRAGLLPRAIESAKKAAADLEVVVVDDCSTDETPDVCARIEGIRYVRLSRNQGLANARNVGISECSSEFIAFLDDDDLWPHDKLEWQVRYLLGNPTVGAVAGGRYWWDGVSLPSPISSRTREIRVITWESLFRGNPIASPGQVLLRRSIIDRVGCLDPDIWGADDFDLWFRIARVTRFELHDRLALLYRIHNSNASHQLDRMLANTRAVIKSQVRNAPSSRTQNLVSTADRWMYDYLGRRIVERLKHEVARCDIHAVLASIRTLANFASEGPDAELIRRMSRDLLPSRKSLRDRLPSPVVRRIRTLRRVWRRPGGDPV